MRSKLHLVLGGLKLEQNDGSGNPFFNRIDNRKFYLFYINIMNNILWTTMVNSAASRKMSNLASRHGSRYFEGNVASVDIMERNNYNCLLYTSPSPRDRTRSRMPSSA